MKLARVAKAAAVAEVAAAADTAAAVAVAVGSAAVVAVDAASPAGSLQLLDLMLDRPRRERSSSLEPYAITPARSLLPVTGADVSVV